ncbi:protein of unknown function [Burkholderia multivorans]
MSRFPVVSELIQNCSMFGAVRRRAGGARASVGRRRRCRRLRDEAMTEGPPATSGASTREGADRKEGRAGLQVERRFASSDARIRGMREAPDATATRVGGTKNKKPSSELDGFFSNMVGVRGFEPPASTSRT